MLDQEFPSVAAGRTLPARCYTEPEVLAAEREALFFRSWRYVCHASLLEEPGSYVATALLDQELFVVRGRDGALRAFYNVCPHRGHRLVEGQGRKGRLTCPYHAWTYELDGRLMRAGRSGSALDGICLSAVRVDRMLDLVFVNLDRQAPPLGEVYPGLAESIAARVPDLSRYRPRAGADYLGGGYACNWKVLIDNFLECHHCEAAHPSFSDLMCIPGTRFEIADGWALQHIPGAGKAENAAFPLDLAEDVQDGDFWFMFPNTMLSVFPGVPNFAVSWADPDGPDRATRSFDIFAPPGISAERERARSEWGLAFVNAEDRALCESVQVGMRQRGYDRGWYLVDPDKPHLTEEAVRFFHRLYRERMGSVAGGQARRRRPQSRSG